MNVLYYAFFFTLGSLLAAAAVYIYLTSKYQKALFEKDKALLRQEFHDEKFEEFSRAFMQKGSEELTESSAKKLEIVLAPLREKLKDFESKIQHVYENEARERFSLKKEIERVVTVNEGLSKALKGDFKTQGIWGELVLEKVLEASGLREGFEYTLQAKDLDLQNEAGQRLRPDVIVHLPEERHLIVDSKVTLNSFERWINLEVGTEKELSERAFIKAVREHVQGLSDKHYQDLSGMRSPDFVFLFLPIEAALVALHHCDPTLFAYAWQKKVVIVGPSTLLPTLKTVESIWKNERQNQYALEIARVGGSLYDKFVSFAEDLLSVSRALSGAQNALEESFKKLRDGKGNLVRQSERLRELGVRAQKKMPEELKKSTDLTALE